MKSLASSGWLLGVGQLLVVAVAWWGTAAVFLVVVGDEEVDVAAPPGLSVCPVDQKRIFLDDSSCMTSRRGASNRKTLCYLFENYIHTTVSLRIFYCISDDIYYKVICPMIPTI